MNMIEVYQAHHTPERQNIRTTEDVSFFSRGKDFQPTQPPRLGSRQQQSEMEKCTFQNFNLEKDTYTESGEYRMTDQSANSNTTNLELPSPRNHGNNPNISVAITRIQAVFRGYLNRRRPRYHYHDKKDEESQASVTFIPINLETSRVPDCCFRQPSEITMSDFNDSDSFVQWEEKNYPNNENGEKGSGKRVSLSGLPSRKNSILSIQSSLSSLPSLFQQPCSCDMVIGPPSRKTSRESFGSEYQKNDITSSSRSLSATHQGPCEKAHMSITSLGSDVESTQTTLGFQDTPLLVPQRKASVQK